MLNKVSRRTRG